MPPKVTLEFDPDNYDANDILAVLKARDLIIALYDMDTYLRDQTKYHSDDLTDDEVAIYEQVRKKLGEIMDEAGVIELVFS